MKEQYARQCSSPDGGNKSAAEEDSGKSAAMAEKTESECSLCAASMHDWFQRLRVHFGVVDRQVLLLVELAHDGTEARANGEEETASEREEQSRAKHTRPVSDAAVNASFRRRA
jgi:hypothetical protein